MLDVMHYLFETDTNFVSSEHMQSKTHSRETIFKHIYDKKLKYTYGGDAKEFSDGEFQDKYLNDDFVNSAVSREVKPYMPPTNFNPESPNPFQGTLREAPLG